MSIYGRQQKENDYLILNKEYVFRDLYEFRYSMDNTR